MAEAIASVTRTHTGDVVAQLDAISAWVPNRMCLYCTDPPYYDNIGYADLSDFFYVWLRRSLLAAFTLTFSAHCLFQRRRNLLPLLIDLMEARDKRKQFFEDGFGKAFAQMRSAQNSEYPLTVFYAFKQSESDDDEGDEHSAVASTGWETMLEGL